MNLGARPIGHADRSGEALERQSAAQELAGSVETGGVISAVTTNCPLRNRVCSNDIRLVSSFAQGFTVFLQHCVQHGLFG